MCETLSSLKLFHLLGFLLASCTSHTSVGPLHHLGPQHPRARPPYACPLWERRKYSTCLFCLQKSPLPPPHLSLSIYSFFSLPCVVRSIALKKEKKGKKKSISFLEYLSLSLHLSLSICWVKSLWCPRGGCLLLQLHSSVTDPARHCLDANVLKVTTQASRGPKEWDPLSASSETVYFFYRPWPLLPLPEQST